MAELAAYWRLEPPIETRIDFGFAQLAALLANIHRDAKRRPKPFSPRDFLPQWDRGGSAEARIDPDQVKAKLAAAFGDRIKGGKRRKPAAPDRK